MFKVVKAQAKQRNVLILLPNGRVHKLVLPFVNMSFREAPLTATMLAALTPQDLPFNITICDASVSRVPSDKHFDLVAISVITGTATEGYKWAEHFKKSGATVVIGGVHATLLPDEAARHADTIVTGYAERSWKQLCRDFINGALKPRYHDDTPELNHLPLPRRDLQKRFGYMIPNTVYATRGCRNTCDFCAVVGAKQGWHTRPVGEVIDEIRALRGSRFAFNDVSLCEDRDYALELCKALEPLRKKWGGLMTTRATDDDELMDALADAGCCYMLLGFESVNADALGGICKRFNAPEHYRAVCDALHGRGISIQGCFIFGLDHDTPSVFSDTVEIVNELRIDIPRYALYTPFPGTEAYRRLSGEGRLLDVNWSWYDTQHVVFRPQNMTTEELDSGFIRAWHETFSLSSIRHRLSPRRRQPYVPLAGNLAYRLYARKLKRDTHRFALSQEDTL